MTRPSSPSAPGTGNELTADVPRGGISLAAGEHGLIDLRLGNLVAGEIRGEAQIMSPYETWDVITPWTQGFAVPGGETRVVSFDVEVPLHHRPGRFWALIKVMYFGRRIYTEAFPVTLTGR